MRSLSPKNFWQTWQKPDKITTLTVLINYLKTMPLLLLAGLISVFLLSPLFISEAVLSQPEEALVLSAAHAETEPPLGLKSRAIYVANPGNDETVWQYKKDLVWPVASLTKLMAALVLLENIDDLNTIVALNSSDMVEGSALRVPAGTRFRTIDLLHAALISSANNAAKAMVRATGMNEEQFVEQMNLKAQNMGLLSTHFTEPTGLDPANRSTAFEIARVFEESLDNDLIRAIINKPSHTLRPLNQNAFTINNTNRLLQENLSYQIIGGKTGFTYTSDFNFVSKFKKDDQEMIVVVLGDEGFLEAFESAKKLAEDAFSQ